MSTTLPTDGYQPRAVILRNEVTIMNRCVTLMAGLDAGLAIFDDAAARSPPSPTPIVEEVMVKTTLLTLNDANITGNFDVPLTKMAKPFRDKLTADALKQGFKPFAGRHIDVIAAMPIVASSKPEIGGRGELKLRAHFDTSPSRLTYQLDYFVSEGEWELVVIDVKVRNQSSSDAGPADLLARASADISAAGSGGRP